MNGPSTPRIGISALFVGLLAVVVSLPTVANGFVGDDVVMIEENPALVQGAKSPAAVFELFRQNYWGDASDAGLYRPMTLLSFVVNRWIFGAKAWGFHLGNCLLHGAVTAALTSLAFAISRRRFVALLTGLFFAVHPTKGEAINSLVGRAELLAALFGILSILCIVRFRQGRHSHRAGLALAFFLFLVALLSKEIVVALPGVVFLGELAVFRRRGDWRRLIVPIVGYGLVLVVYLGLRHLALGRLTVPADHAYFALAGADDAERWMTAVGVMGRLFVLFALPFRLSADYSLGVVPLVLDPTDPVFLSGAVVLGVGLILMTILARSLPLASVGLVFFFVVYAPVSNWVFPIGVVMAERLLYLPSAGLFLFIAVVLDRRFLCLRATTRRFCLGALSFLVVVLAVRNVDRGFDWRDNRTLFCSVLAVAPGSSLANYNIGAMELAAGRFAKAKERFVRALESRPRYDRATLGLAAILEQERRYEEAILRLVPMCSRNIDLGQKKLLPVYADAHRLLARLYEQKGELRAAEFAWQEAERLQPTNTQGE